MALTACVGSGRSYRDSDPTGERDVTLHLVRSESEALCAAFEDLVNLPADFTEVAHLTLADGDEITDYENTDCRCSEPIVAGAKAYQCEALR